MLRVADQYTVYGTIDYALCRLEFTMPKHDMSYDVNNYTVRSYRLVIVVTSSITRRTIRDYSHVIKT